MSVVEWWTGVRRGVLSQRGAVGFGSLLALFAVLSGLLVGSGNASRVLDVGDGRGWVSDNSPGGSGVAGVSVGSADSDWRGVGTGTVVQVVVGVDGLVWAQVKVGERFVWRRVGKDGSVEVESSGGAGDQVVLTGGGRSWLVDLKASVVQALAASGKSPGSRRVEPGVRSGVLPVAGVDDEGRLVVSAVSSMVVFEQSRGRVVERSRFDAPKELSAVATVDERLVLVAASSGRGVVVDDAKAGRGLDLGVSGDGLLVPARSVGDVLWILDPDSGRVVGTGLDGRRAGSITLPGGVVEWEPPVVVGDVVMIRANVDGRLALWRGSASSGRFERVDLDEIGDIGSCATRCPDVFESGGRLWVNSPVAPDVAVVDAAGVVRVISKNRPAADGNGEGRGGGDQGDGPKLAEGSPERAEVPPVPFRRPVGAPPGAGQVSGANPNNPTSGGDDAPNTVLRLNGTPDTVKPRSGNPPAGGGDPMRDGVVGSVPDPLPGEQAARATTACTNNSAITGDQSKPPATPTGVTAIPPPPFNDGGSIQASWTRAPGPIACTYTVEVIASDGELVDSRAVDGTNLSLSTRTLPPGSYRVLVSATNAAGPSDPSSFTIEISPRTAPRVLELDQIIESARDAGGATAAMTYRDGAPPREESVGQTFTPSQSGQLERVSLKGYRTTWCSDPLAEFCYADQQDIYDGPLYIEIRTLPAAMRGDCESPQAGCSTHGDVLGYGSYNGRADPRLPPEPGLWAEVDLAVPARIEAGQQYLLRWRTDRAVVVPLTESLGGGYQAVGWQLPFSTEPYAGGHAWKQFGDVWLRLNDSEDFQLRTWVRRD